MSQENVEVVRRFYRAMEDRDLAMIRTLARPDVEWIPDPKRVGEGPVRGVDNVARFFLDRSEMFQDLHLEAERFLDADDRVLVFLRVTGKGAASGAGFEIRIAHLLTLRDGMLVRGQGFGDRNEALEAAGLSE